jgi:hypothetical protein
MNVGQVLKVELGTVNDRYQGGICGYSNRNFGRRNGWLGHARARGAH